MKDKNILVHVVLRRSGYHYFTASFNKVWSQILCRFNYCLQHVRDLQWWESLTMVPAWNKASCLSLVNQSTKTIHQYQKNKKTDYRLGMGKCILVKSIKSVTLKLRYSCDCMWTISVRQTNWNGELKMDPLLEDRATKNKPFSQQLQIWSNTVKEIVGNRQLIVSVSLIIVWG